MVFRALDVNGEEIAQQSWCSIGGGFICREADINLIAADDSVLSYPFIFSSGNQLLELGRKNQLSIAQMMMANECSVRSEQEVEQYLDGIISAMMTCIDRGMRAEGELPGGLHVRRRAKAICDQLKANPHSNLRNPHEVMDWVSVSFPLRSVPT